VADDYLVSSTWPQVRLLQQHCRSRFPRFSAPIDISPSHTYGFLRSSYPCAFMQALNAVLRFPLFTSSE
jgi:hypothetical protein